MSVWTAQTFSMKGTRTVRASSSNRLSSTSSTTTKKPLTTMQFNTTTRLFAKHRTRQFQQLTRSLSKQPNHRQTSRSCPSQQPWTLSISSKNQRNSKSSSARRRQLRAQTYTKYRSNPLTLHSAHLSMFSNKLSASQDITQSKMVTILAVSKLVVQEPAIFCHCSETDKILLIQGRVASRMLLKTRSFEKLIH